MKMTDPVIPYAPPEQQRYASVLSMGTRIGLALLVIGFCSYAFEWIPPLVPHESLATVWNQPLARYLELTGVPSRALVALGLPQGLVGDVARHRVEPGADLLR